MKVRYSKIPKVFEMEKAERFVRVWQSSNSANEVSRKLGFSTARSAVQRACRLRRMGVKLKVMPRKPMGMRIDWKKLDKLAAITLKAAKEKLERAIQKKHGSGKANTET